MRPTADGGSYEPATANSSLFVEEVEGLGTKKLKEILSNHLVTTGVEAKVSDAEGKAIMRAYLDLVNAAKELATAEYGGSELDIGIHKFPFSNTSAATNVCFLVSLVVSVAFVGVAVLMSIWGFEVHGTPTKNVTALQAYSAGATVAQEDVVCSVEAQDKFKLDTFLGWPEERVFWNLYGGLILGLVFGFLDNFGLFYGMGALDPFFYGFGSKVAAGIMTIFGRTKDSPNLIHDLHTVTSDLMAGLGNTFSDLLGVALGTAALEIAKAGLNADPAFWALDLLAIVIGCLLGCFMPVLVKHKDRLGDLRNAFLIQAIAWINIFGLFTAVFLAGVPYEGAHIASFVIVCGNIVFLLLMLLVTSCVGSGLLDAAVATLES